MDLHHITTLVAEHWLKGALWLAGLLAFIPGLIWAWYSWKSRNFMNRVNSSLNFRKPDGRFTFVTIDECELADLYNLYGRICLTVMARQKTAFLRFGTADDAWAYLNVVLNHLSSKFGEGALASLKGGATGVELVFGITCERHEDLKTRKFRIMLAEPALLEEIAAGLLPTYDDERHNEMRGRTLQEMAQMYAAKDHNLRKITLYIKD